MRDRKICDIAGMQYLNPRYSGGITGHPCSHQRIHTDIPNTSIKLLGSYFQFIIDLCHPSIGFLTLKIPKLE